MLRWFKSLINNFKQEPLSEGSSSYVEEGYNMWLFVGLGNPDDKYKNNRHNIGFMVVDSIANEFPAFDGFRSKFQGKISQGRMAGQKVILLKPQTFMNESGLSVAKAAKFYQIEPDKIIVFHDELDINAGDVRVKFGGGNAGHNGLKSIQAHLGSADFWRVRIGIGRPSHRGAVSNYVLDDFSKAERIWLNPLVEFMGDKADIIISDSPKIYEQIIKENKNGI